MDEEESRWYSTDPLIDEALTFIDWYIDKPDELTDEELNEFINWYIGEEIYGT